MRQSVLLYDMKGEKLKFFHATDNAAPLRKFISPDDRYGLTVFARRPALEGSPEEKNEPGNEKHNPCPALME